MFEYFGNLPEIIIELFRENPLAQWIGLIAFVASIINFTFMKNRAFVWGTLIASLLWGLNFFFLGAFAAAYINFFDVFKNAAALAWEKSKKALMFFLIMYVFIGVWQFYSAYSVDGLSFTTVIKGFIPTFTALLSTYLVFKTTGVKMKAGFLIVVAAWLIYNIYFQNIGGILTDATLGIMGLVGIWKDLKEEKRKKK